MMDETPQVCGTCYWWGRLDPVPDGICLHIGDEGDGRQYLPMVREQTPNDPYCYLISTEHYTCNSWEKDRGE